MEMVASASISNIELHTVNPLFKLIKYFGVNLQINENIFWVALCLIFGLAAS